MVEGDFRSQIVSFHSQVRGLGPAFSYARDLDSIPVSLGRVSSEGAGCRRSLVGDGFCCRVIGGLRHVRLSRMDVGHPVYGARPGGFEPPRTLAEPH